MECAHSDYTVGGTNTVIKRRSLQTRARPKSSRPSVHGPVEAVPPEVLELIWEFVRDALRPRMRAGLKRDVRLLAAVYMGRTHGMWLKRVYECVVGDLHAHHAVMCAWKYVHVPGIYVDHIPPHVAFRASIMYEMLPEPVTDGGDLHYGPPRWGPLLRRLLSSGRLFFQS